MKNVIPGNDFFEQYDKAIFLNYFDVYPFIKYNELRCSDFQEYVNSLTLLEKHGYINQETLENSLKRIYETAYTEIQEEMIQEEEYKTVNLDGRQALICNNRCLFFKQISDGDNNHYIIGAYNRDEDESAYDIRNIPFLIRKDSPIYSCIDIFYNLNDKKNINVNGKYNKNNLEVKKDEESNYILTFGKHRKDKNLSNSIVGALYIDESNENYNFVDYLYNVLKSNTKGKGKLKIKK